MMALNAGTEKCDMMTLNAELKTNAGSSAEIENVALNAKMKIRL